MKRHSGPCSYASTSHGLTNRCVYCGRRQRLMAGHMVEHGGQAPKLSHVALWTVYAGAVAASLAAFIAGVAA